MTLRKPDISDIDYVDADELRSDGTLVYLTVSVVSTTTGTQIVIIGTPSDGEGILTGVDHLVESGDIAVLTGTSGGAADGSYLVDLVLTDNSFSTVEAIASSTGGSVDFIYPPGVRRIGLDPTGLQHITSNILEGAIEELDAALPAPVEIGQIIYSADGTTWVAATPITSNSDGWLVNEDGELLVSFPT